MSSWQKLTSSHHPRWHRGAQPARSSLETRIKGHWRRIACGMVLDHLIYYSVCSYLNMLLNRHTLHPLPLGAFCGDHLSLSQWAQHLSCLKPCWRSSPKESWVWRTDVNLANSVSLLWEPAFVLRDIRIHCLIFCFSFLEIKRHPLLPNHHWNA